jgi:hypothetical protein
LEETGVFLFPRTPGWRKYAKKKAEYLLRFCRFADAAATYPQIGKRRLCQMQYLLLIYHGEEQWEALSEPERQAIYGEYRALRADLEKAGKFIGGSQLQPTATATVIRVRNGSKSVTDGPFAETKEQLGGYFLVEANNLDEAMDIAARIPSARMGSIEVRPVVSH